MLKITKSSILFIFILLSIPVLASQEQAATVKTGFSFSYEFEGTRKTTLLSNFTTMASLLPGAHQAMQLFRSANTIAAIDRVKSFATKMLAFAEQHSTAVKSTASIVATSILGAIGYKYFWPIKSSVAIPACCAAAIGLGIYGLISKHHKNEIARRATIMGRIQETLTEHGFEALQHIAHRSDKKAIAQLHQLLLENRNCFIAIKKTKTTEILFAATKNDELIVNPLVDPAKNIISPLMNDFSSCEYETLATVTPSLIGNNSRNLYIKSQTKNGCCHGGIATNGITLKGVEDTLAVYVKARI